MTEAEWLTSTDPEAMLASLRGQVSDRKVRLFAVACCRHLLRQVPVNSRDVRAVEVAERYADGGADAAELQRAAAGTTPDWTAALACQEAASPEGGVDAAIYSADNATREAGSHAAFLVDEDEDGPSFAAGRGAERVVQTALLRDILGNPFRPVFVSPAWLTPTVAAVAQAAYDQRSLPEGTLHPHRLAVLADALEEAGCTDEEVLGHLRGPGPHVRGCWPVDSLLGKE